MWLALLWWGSLHLQKKEKVGVLAQLECTGTCHLLSLQMWPGSGCAGPPMFFFFRTQTSFITQAYYSTHNLLQEQQQTRVSRHLS